MTLSEFLEKVKSLGMPVSEVKVKATDKNIFPIADSEYVQIHFTGKNGGNDLFISPASISDIRKYPSPDKENESFWLVRLTAEGFADLIITEKVGLLVYVPEEREDFMMLKMAWNGYKTK